MWESFKDLFLAAINDCIPKAKSKKKKGWHGLITMVCKKKRLLKIALRHPKNISKMKNIKSSVIN